MERTTKEAIIEAAEQLFATYGFSATSLRQVTATAGVNLAAVNYHFRSKAALIDIVLQRILEPLAEAREHNIARLTAEAGVPSLEAVLQAYYIPFFELLDPRNAVGYRRRQIIGRLASEPDEEIRKSISRYLAPVTEKYFALFRQIVPHLSPGEFAWRFRAMHGIVITQVAETLIPAPLPVGTDNEPSTSTNQQSFSWTMTYLAAAWRAAATDEET